MAVHSSTPWKTEKWFVSPWNFDEDVKLQIGFPEKLSIHDITLRDGEQQAGLIFNKDEKIRIAEKLAEIGVHRIEAGMPAVSAQDTEAIKEIVKRKLGPKIFAFSRCMKEDVKRAADCGVDGIVIEIPSSEHIIQYAYEWTTQKAVDLSIEATRFAKEQGLYTVFFPIDGTRAQIDWFLDLITKVATEGHMDALAIVDTFGCCSPHSIPFLVREIKKRIDKPLEAHFHDDFGLGVSNTLLALGGGVEVAHTTVSGIGERAGNVAYEELVLALKTMYAKDIGIKTERMVELSRMVRDITKLSFRSNRPIIGDTLFQIESGIISDWYKKVGRQHRLELTPYAAELVGQAEPSVVMGKKSGIASIRLWLEELHMEASEAQVERILQDVKKRAFEKKSLLSKEEFRAIAAAVVGGRA